MAGVKNDYTKVGKILAGVQKNEIGDRKFQVGLVMLPVRLRFLIVGLEKAHCHPAEIEKHFTRGNREETHRMTVGYNTRLNGMHQLTAEVAFHTVTEIAHIENGRH